MSTLVPTRWYRFRQNNSGGSFIEDRKAGITIDVWIEAIDAAHANQRAQNRGIYFNGVASGIDCGCCGDRWSPVDSYDAEDDPKIRFPNPDAENFWERDGDFYWTDFVALHHIDNRIEIVSKP